MRTSNQNWVLLVLRVKQMLFMGGLLLGIQGCTVEGGCEYYYSYGTNTYHCSDEVGQGIFGPPPDSEVCFWGDGNTFHQGSSCSSLGYNQPDGTGHYQYNSNQDPSPWGAYASSAGATTGTPCDYTTVWTGNPNDIQVSTQCQTACVYADAGNEQGRAAACSIVAQWGATSSCWICQ